MAQIETGVYQFTGRYKKWWSDILPYDRWAESLNFKYYGEYNWGGEIPKGVKLDDLTKKIQQTADGNLTWANSDNKWEHNAIYRITVDTNTVKDTDPYTVKFEKL